MKTVLNLLNNNVMKNAINRTFAVKKNYTKYICALLLLAGVNVSAWGALTTSETLPIAIAGVYDADDGYATCTKTITFNTTYSGVNHNVYFTEYDDEINSFALTSNVAGYNSGYFTPSYSGNVTLTLTVYGNTDGTYDGKIIVTAYSGSSPYPTLEIPIKVTITGSCTSHSISLTDAGSKIGGSFSTNVSSSCADETITITATPDAGYRVDSWTVLDGNAEDVELSGTGNTRTFTMPNSDTEVEVTFAAQTYDVTLKPNGGSGSDQVVSVTYDDVPPTTLKGGGAIVIPTRTGYAFDGYYDNTSGGTQYYSYKGSPKVLAAEELWDKPNDANLYARWIANITTVTLDKGTGGTTDGIALIDYDATEYGDIEHAVNNTTGYHLDGYYTNTQVKVLDADGSFAATDVTGYITDGKWSNTSDEVTLYAHWVLNTYTISFDKNGGSGSMGDVEKAYGSSYALPACGFTAPSGKVFDGWAEGSAGGTSRAVGYSHTVTANITFYAKWRDASYTDYVFSCAELTLTGPTGDLIFITSAASKTVRSQEAFHVTGSGLTPSTTLTFAMSDPTIADKFAFKQADGSAVATDASGAIDMDFYVFYTPASEDTEDGLVIFTNLSASVSGTKPKTSAALTDKTVIGRHLPADFVIAAKRNGKWYAIPSNMTMAESTTPVEIAVDDANNPTIAYTATTNNYSLYDQALSTGVKLAMHGQSDAPLAASPTTTGIGKSSATVVTNNQADNYLWLFAQTNTEVATAAEAKYTMKSLGGYNNYFVRLKENAGNPIWGQYDSGNSELRLIPASSVVPTEAEIVAWGQHNAIVEVDKANAGGTGFAAAKVKAKLNGAESSLITLTETGTSKGSTTKYDYTVAFGDVIDFAAAANAGQMLTLEWYNSSDALIAVSNIMVPRIIASSATMSSIESRKTYWNTASAPSTEVHVLPGVTLTADAGSFTSGDVTIPTLEIYPGATVNVTTGTLNVTNLIMRNGWDRLNGEKKYDVARLYINASANLGMPTNAYADWYIDYDQYYPIAVPWEVTVANIQYKNTNSDAVVSATGSVRLRYYDGASRAANGQSGVDAGSNWKLYGADGCTAVPATLTPSTGYAMTAKRPTGKAFSIVRMPLTIPSAAWTTAGEQGEVTSTYKDQVAVTAHGVDDPSKPRYTKGWNLVANPYMSLHRGALSYTEGGETIEYANIPDENFKEFDQQPIATTKLKPSSGFLIQAPKDGTVTFGTGSRVAAAPSYRNAGYEEQKPVQRAYILLANDDSEDMMGLLVGEKYTAEYEMNADLEKLLSDGNTLRTYIRYNDLNMAYVAINEGLAKELIPVVVRIPTGGEYTFRLHDASTVDELEGVYLTDYLTGKTTNLLYDEYTFTAEAGTPDNRFALNAVVGKRDVPTGADITGVDKNGCEPVKFIWHDKVYILHNSMIYDATGKRVHVINK